ncbi:hypothetical protein M8C21_000952 [Ambrosia artemisiifolia]|uniref:MYND-type domain-containing protein n=1 Tax=Ambrosia artemisiifolia TaxID=4212 RepID=A0AAD5BT32_AMBAR|nr:hypothetical protein M8C21_000952 [Ambrosia artemisiifolia]
MRTRRRSYYEGANNMSGPHHKRLKLFSTLDYLDSLPDDIVLLILANLCSTATSPADFITVLSTCKRLNSLGVHSLVLSKASLNCLAVNPKNWSESSHRFLKRCSDAGSAEASYTLGMIRFYCLQNRTSGASLMAKAAIRSHAPALYSLAVIQFNGSGGMKNDKDLRAGVALCARAAFLGHVDALRELGHCLQDGYGVPKNVTHGRRLLIQANARELARVFSLSSNQLLLTGSVCPLFSDFGCNVPAPDPHHANRFLVGWFSDKLQLELESPDTRLCSYGGCGRMETRRHEFRRCSVCGDVNYCSRACQARDWKLHHNMTCRVGLEGVGFNANVNDTMVDER